MAKAYLGRTEHQEQVFFLAEFEKNWPSLRILAIPNGGGRKAREAFQLKCEGVRPGVPDLLIPAKQIWIELKRADGGKGLSPEQQDWKAYLESEGQTVIVGKGAEDALAQLMPLLPPPYDPLAGILGAALDCPA